jgi:hypothetical protein
LVLETLNQVSGELSCQLEQFLVMAVTRGSFYPFSPGLRLVSMAQFFHVFPSKPDEY